MMKILNRNCLWFTALLLPAALSGAAPAPHAENGPRTQYDKTEFRRRPAWERALAALSEGERQMLFELSRTNPGEFRRRMRKLMPKPVEHPQVSILLDRYSRTPDAAERAELKQELKQVMLRLFRQRLADNRRQLDAVQRRLDNLRADCERREHAAERIVNARVERMLAPPPPAELIPRLPRQLDPQPDMPPPRKHNRR